MLLHFIFVVKEEELEQRKWEFRYVEKMAGFYKSWIKNTFSKDVEIQTDEMIVRTRKFSIVDVPALLDDHRSRGVDIFHFYLSYFRPIWTDCTCEGYFADNFGMIKWEKSPQIDDIQFLVEKNCTKVSHELAHEFLRQSGFKNYKEVVHEIWDKHLFASLSFEYYDENYKKTDKNGLFATLDTSSIRL